MESTLTQIFLPFKLLRNTVFPVSYSGTEDTCVHYMKFGKILISSKMKSNNHFYFFWLPGVTY